MRRLALALAVLLVACEGDVAPAAAPLAQALPSPGAEEVILDVRADGATLFGRVVPPPPNADPDRVLVLRSELAGQPIAPALEGARVLDARFAGGALVVLGTDHVLYAHEGGAVVELDAQVFGPLSAAGDRVAYVRGEMPELEVARADVRTGEAVSITQGMAPAWSPALSADGREVIFVSGVTGSPRLYRSEGGASRALPPVERFPTAPSSPRWVDDRLIFEDEQGVAAIDLREGTLLFSAPGARELFAMPDGRLGALGESGLETVGGAR